MKFKTKEKRKMAQLKNWMKVLPNFMKLLLAMCAQSDEEKLELLDGLKGRAKLTLASTIEKDENKLKAIDKMVEFIVNSIIIDDEIKLQAQDEIRLQALDKMKLKIQDKLIIIETIKDKEKKFKALDAQKEIETEKREVIKRLYQKNNDVIGNIDLRLLDEKYLNTLGEDKINLISCYPKIQEKIVELSGNEYAVLISCINHYEEKAGNNQWTEIADSILRNIREYSDLIENIQEIEQVNIGKLSILLQNENKFNIRQVEDIANFETIRKEKCDEWIKEENNFVKKEAILQKIFSHDFNFASLILRKFGDDIENIENSYEKDYVRSLKAILGIVDDDILTEIYEKTKEIQLVDKTIMQNGLKELYNKEYNRDLFQIKQNARVDEQNLEDDLNGLEVYDAGTDFKMIVTSIAPFLGNTPDNFKTDWNRPAISTQHFCTSYIRNDMLGTTPIPHLCYGFFRNGEGGINAIW